jgi:hypothetical protein
MTRKRCCRLSLRQALFVLRRDLEDRLTIAQDADDGFLADTLAVRISHVSALMSDLHSRHQAEERECRRRMLERTSYRGSRHERG